MAWLRSWSRAGKAYSAPRGRIEPPFPRETCVITRQSQRPRARCSSTATRGRRALCCAPMTAPTDDTIRLFDYGSLMAGERDHALVAASKLVGPARTKAEYHLVDLGIYPALVRG